MDAVSASGLFAIRSGFARLDAVAGQVATVRTLTIPAASPQDATTPRAVAGQRPAPPPPAEPGDRAPSSSSYVGASVDMIRAETEVRMGAALIRTANEMTRTLLDIKA